MMETSEISVAIGAYLLHVAWHGGRRLAPSHHARRFAALLAGLVLLQWLAGAVNVGLKAPVWMQLVHLDLADMTWITLILLAATTLAGTAQSEPLAESGRAVPGAGHQPLTFHLYG